MAIGRLNSEIEIFTPVFIKDKDLFTERSFVSFAKIHAVAEEKNSTEKWKNSTLLAEADAIFTIRFLKNVDHNQIILFKGNYYNILSVENIKNKSMYLQITAKMEVPENG